MLVLREFCPLIVQECEIQGEQDRLNPQPDQPIYLKIRAKPPSSTFGGRLAEMVGTRRVVRGGCYAPAVEVSLQFMYNMHLNARQCPGVTSCTPKLYSEHYADLVRIIV